jgi:hypothetical protein
MGIGNSKCRNALGLLAFSVLAAGFQRPVASPSQLLLIAAGAFAGIAIARSGLLRLWQLLLAYGFAARIPVPVVILLGILNGWNTHYDSAPPGLPDLGSFARWIAIGVIPQSRSGSSAVFSSTSQHKPEDALPLIRRSPHRTRRCSHLRSTKSGAR